MGEEAEYHQVPSMWQPAPKSPKESVPSSVIPKFKTGVCTPWLLTKLGMGRSSLTRFLICCKQLVWTPDEPLGDYGRRQLVSVRMLQQRLLPRWICVVVISLFSLESRCYGKLYQDDIYLRDLLGLEICQIDVNFWLRNVINMIRQLLSNQSSAAQYNQTINSRCSLIH